MLTALSDPYLRPGGVRAPRISAEFYTRTSTYCEYSPGNMSTRSARRVAAMRELTLWGLPVPAIGSVGPPVPVIPPTYCKNPPEF